MACPEKPHGEADKEAVKSEIRVIWDWKIDTRGVRIPPQNGICPQAPVLKGYVSTHKCLMPEHVANHLYTLLIFKANFAQCQSLHTYAGTRYFNVFSK